MRFVKFLIVGGLGFFVDVCALYFLAYCGIDFILGRFLSFFAAVFSTWILNSLYTFKDEKFNYKFGVKKFMNYLLCCTIGGFFNIAIYSIIINVNNLENERIIFAAAVGSISGSFINYTLSKYFIFLRGR
jgi:putative flippase GtrA